MNIIKRELKSNIKSMTIWSASIVFLITVWMIEYGSFADNEAINDFMASMPQGLLNALGMGNLTLSSLTGFIGAIAIYLYLLLGIEAVLLGSSIISKEERDKTAEYLFTLPVSREKVLVSKIISAVINLAILNAVTFGAMLINTMKYDKGENYYSFMALLFGSIFIVQMIFLSIGMLVSSVNKKYKKSGNISVAIIIVMFLISSLMSMVDSVDFLRYVTPFQYFDPQYIANELSLEPLFVVISLIIIAGGIAGTLVFYPKRDLYI